VKRKAQELRGVAEAEAKAADAMKALKQANNKIASTGDAETQVQQVIAKETQKMNAQADAVKEVRTKASSRVVVNDGPHPRQRSDYRIHWVSSEEQPGQRISRASLETFNWFVKLDSKYSVDCDGASGNIGGCH
jgi:hypothetical protein